MRKRIYSIASSWFATTVHKSRDSWATKRREASALLQPYFYFVMSIRFNQFLLSLSAGVFFLVSASSHAAGFDCSKAASATEQAICADGKLSKLDSDLSVAWKNASDVTIDPLALNSSQLKWLKIRDACGVETSCLSSRYKERLDLLSSNLSAVDVDHAGNRLEALVTEAPQIPPGTEEKRCTVDKRLCVRIVHDGDDSRASIQIDSAGASLSTYRFLLSDIPDDSRNINVTLWPRLLRLADGSGSVVVGVRVNFSTSYSGGGGSASELRLFEIRRDGSSVHEREVLSIPIEGSLMIRACFTARDERRRLGACHDEYRYTTVLGIDHTVKSGFPRLLYATRATSFPGKVSRGKDSLEGPPLRRRDLITALDKKCTYKRIFDFDRSAGVYIPDRPLPDCGDYTVP
ncbi:lysozyme inhibitor LprI family protein [Burkholderia sp. SRS-W-2-2016]|uniref:lysozyme inhibitor LprI family protein n=1 Tax=Burkholderia sp. SRS-W-2-2016 TaxID=1926878 RepID=UPI000A4DCAD9|nr:lysozyme inhibitor LprI family protein [Burkholderia sp. SRS-W-2-2016]